MPKKLNLIEHISSKQKKQLYVNQLFETVASTLTEPSPPLVTKLLPSLEKVIEVTLLSLRDE